jgi:serine/threonine-protein kinase
MRLGYRESPLPLVSLPDGEVTVTRPSPTLSGMIEAWATSKGDLRYFHAVPPQVDDSAAGREVDLAAISRAIGFDISQWQETKPRFTPLYAFDWSKAWKGQHPALPFEVTVQAAAWHGKMVDLQVLSPWSPAWRDPKAFKTSWQYAARTLLEKLSYGLLFVFSIFMAARNLRAGRGDRRGAWRLAIGFFLLQAAIWGFSAHWVVDIAILTILKSNATDWFASAAIIWVLYIALEPSVRARWPHAILTWSRLLAGRWQDAQVAAHVLYGAVVGVLIAWFFLAAQWFNASQGSLITATADDAGTSARLWIADVMGRAYNAAEFGLIVVFAIFCLRAVCRRDWIAAGAAAVLFTLAEQDSWQGNIANFFFFFVIFALLVWVLMRLGLVATITALFCVNSLLRTPGAQNLTKPYEWAVALYPAMILCIVIWAFWRTSGQRLMTMPEEEG